MRGAGVGAALGGERADLCEDIAFLLQRAVGASPHCRNCDGSDRNFVGRDQMRLEVSMWQNSVSQGPTGMDTSRGLGSFTAKSRSRFRWAAD